ncbi:MAG: hypothetical protein PHY48_16010 [Candidatus Cloacimonetes bacterium]|nr:hypothetical protein [Candidatus Cloacimonadota bacterium]
MNKITAILDNQLPEILKKIGILEDIHTGNYTCISCGEVITIENFSTISESEDGIFVITCTKSSCHDKLKG